MLLGEPLDGAGNRGSGSLSQQAQAGAPNAHACALGWRSVTCAGLGPALAVSHLARATRRSQGSLPQHMSRGPVIGHLEYGRHTDPAPQRAF